MIPFVASPSTEEKTSNITIQKQDTNFVVFAYGIVPPLLNHSKIKQSLLRKDPTHEGIVKLKCGAEHFVCLTEKNALIIGGSNKYGQCGYTELEQLEALKNKPVTKEDQEKTEEPEPQNNHIWTVLKIDGHEILDIAAGSYHTMILVKRNEDGLRRLLCMGHELGSGFLDKKHRCNPTEIFIPGTDGDPIKKIFAGQLRSAAVLESGRIFMWGEWFSGQKQRHPVEINMTLDEGDNIKKISIGKMHALIITKKGKLYSVGDNTYGELGEPRNVRGRDRPATIEFFNNWGRVCKGFQIIDCEAGCRHSIILDNMGNIYTFGDNSEGQCGLEENRVYTPKIVDVPDIFADTNAKASYIFAGDAHSACLTLNGDLFAWGDNSAGRLGIESNGSVFHPTLVDELVGRNLCGACLGGFFSIFVAGTENNSLLKKYEIRKRKTQARKTLRLGGLKLPIKL
ncbi:unnamed protein product [Blepharisma stoltei]|uniref:RCC1-like domain-containing protein n=1 Tax=Blepharisma stoltei TaxID=1481888 RepID=A0AAU9K6T7_9CILI|nr:unnamed protein product [Blepharisma stoltei]